MLFDFKQQTQLNIKGKISVFSKLLLQVPYLLGWGANGKRRGIKKISI